MENRRQFLMSASALTLVGCATPCALPPLPGPDLKTALIDGHCHLFNAKDLSTVRFLSYVVAKHYPQQATLHARDIQDPDYVDLFMEVVLAVAGADAAPSATTELAVLSGRQLTLGHHTTDVEPQDPALAEAKLRQRLADFVGGKSFLTRSPTPGHVQAERELRDLILQTGGAPGGADTRSPQKLTDAQRRAVVDRALSGGARDFRSPNDKLSEIYLPGLFEFVRQLKRFRHCLVDELAHLHRDVSGQNPLMLVPAMVDFGRWLRDDPDKGSTFVDQINVWSAISKRPGGPAVHGYVAFCPLRQVEFDRKRFSDAGGPIETDCGAVSPLRLVEDALTKHGFLGVKVYPPMGFRASKNGLRGPGDHPFPVAVLGDVFGHEPNSDAEVRSMSRELGDLLDQALADLFALCRKYNAPVMAHGGNSVGANCDTGELADPYYWGPVFDSPDAPPIMLAHFGGFAYWSADPASPGYQPPHGVCQARTGTPPFDATWEVWLARYIQQNPSKPVFADISYLSSILADDNARATALGNFKKLEAVGLTAIRDHLVFGTDWVMLAQEKNADAFAADARAFLREAFGDAYVDPIMRTNFLRYASLNKGGQTFQRISTVYDNNPVLIGRLNAVCG